MTAVIHIELEVRHLDEMMAYLCALPAEKQGRITVEPNGSRKLTHEQLMALPEAEMLDYSKKHGGVVAVAKENGYALSEDAADDILESKRQRTLQLQIERGEKPANAR